MPYTSFQGAGPDPFDASLQAGTGMLLDAVAPGASKIQDIAINTIGLINKKDQFGMGSGGGDLAEGFAKGGTIGAVKSLFDRKKKQQAKTNWQNQQFAMNQQYNPMVVPDASGYSNSFYAEEGGQPGEPQQPQQEQQPQQPQVVPVNVELGEIAINPMNFEILQKFDNPNRFTKHNKNKFLESKGNFIQLDPSAIVIPKDLAQRYTKGSALTRKSIVAEILKNQANREHAGEQEMSAPQADPMPQMEEGGMAGDGGRPGFRKKVLGIGNVDDALAGADIVDKITGFLKPKPLGVLPSVYDKQLNYTEPSSLNYTEPNSPIPTMNIDELNATGEAGFTNPTISPTIKPKLKTDMPPKAGKDWGVPLSRAATAIPTIYGMAVAKEQDPNLQYVQNDNYDAAMASINMIPENVNIESSKAVLNRGLAANNNVMRNVNSPSVRAEMANANSELIGKTGELYQDASEKRNGMVANKLMQIAGLQKEKGANREQAKVRFNTESSQDRAARQTMTQSALSEGATNFSKGVMDDQKLKAVNKLAKYFKIDPTSKELVYEKDGASDEIIKSILGMGSIVPNVTATGKGINKNQTKYDRKGNVIGSTKTETTKQN